MAVVQKRDLDAWRDPNADPYIEIINISKTFGETVALRHVSLSIYKGEFFSMLGASGCGKTTLLRILAGFERPTDGKILIDGEDVTHWPPYRRPVNMMFQSYALFPHMTVWENVAFGLHFDGLPGTDINDRVAHVLDLVQMSNFKHRKPDQLSGGQKQRVALARSLVKSPKLLLLDEPLGALDKKLREQTQFELVNIQEKVGITFVMVTHDQEEALTMSTRLCVMREGEISQIGMPHEVYEFPNSRYVADFIGSANVFDGVVIGQEGKEVLIESYDMGTILRITCTAAIPIGSHVAVAIRPEKVYIGKEPPARGGYHNLIENGVIKEIAYLGDMSIYHVELPSGKMIQASMPNFFRLSERDVTWDDEVFLAWKPENGMVLSI